MLPTGSSDKEEEAFIKARKPYLEEELASLLGALGRRPNGRLGLSALQTLIHRSAANHDGVPASVTSVFLFPFLAQPRNDDHLLRLLARCCPNLKNLSLYGSYFASEEAILEVIRSCKILELVDFADSPNFIPLVLEELDRCCPGIRGIRRNGVIESSAISYLVANFPQLELLNLSDTPILEDDLLTIVSGCFGLLYLDVRGCGKFKSDFRVIQRASAQISEFFYDRDIGFVDVSELDYLLYCMHSYDYNDCEGASDDYNDNDYSVGGGDDHYDYSDDNYY